MTGRLLRAFFLLRSQSSHRKNFILLFYLAIMCVLFSCCRYQAQVTLISSLLSPVYGAELEVGTVDGMQGREKEAIVISLVRSNENVSPFPSRDKPHSRLSCTARSRLLERQTALKWYATKTCFTSRCTNGTWLYIVAMTRAKRHVVGS